MADSKYRVQVADAVPASPGVLSKGPTYRNIGSKDDFPFLPEAQTCWDIMESTAKKFPSRPALGKREIVDGKAGEFVFQSYEEVYGISKCIGSALRYLGIEKQGKVGVYGVNSPEWVMAMEGVNSQSMCCVPLYDTLGADAIEFIIKHAEISAVFVQAAKIPALASGLAKCADLVKNVISFAEWDAGSKEKVESLGMKTFSWAEFVQLGKENPAEVVPPSPEEVCTIMYTSGTTGEPKGVILTHKSIISSIAGLKAFLKLVKMDLDETDVNLSYLPLAHIYERSSLELALYNGSSTGFWQGDVKALSEDIGALKPTYFAGVPRIFDRMHAGIKGKVSESKAIVRFLFNFFYDRKLKGIRNGKAHNKAGPIADTLVFGKVKARLGGRVKFIVSGAAPLAPHVEEFLKVTMCAPVVQGYGLTETCAGGFLAIPNQIKQQGTCGPPNPCVEVRLESVPEMQYDALASPARGEICLRGACLFSGYYKRQDLTAEALDSDGWFHTGDVGEWQADGSMKIIDRKKNIFKLSQGEYVAVENLENVYGNCLEVDMVWVYGNSFESSLVGVAVPNEEKLKGWAKQNGLESASYEELCQNDLAKKWILDHLTAVGKNGKLKGFEMMRAIHLDSAPFDIERDLLTPTFKKKRPQLLKYYKSDIDQMYEKLREIEASKKA